MNHLKKKRNTIVDSEKEKAKQVFGKVFGLKRGDWVKKKYRGRKTWVIVHIYTFSMSTHHRWKGKKVAACWRKRPDSRYRMLFWNTVSELILLSDLTLIEDKKNPEYLDVPRSK